MTGAAWLTLALTWSVVLFFATRFFWKIATTPTDGEGDAPEASDSTGPE